MRPDSGVSQPLAQQIEDDLSRLMGMGIDAHDAGRLDDAAAVYRTALLIAPSHYDALWRLGFIASLRGHLSDAADLLGKASAIRPEDPQVHFLFGNVMHKLGRPAEAIAGYNRAITLKPDHAPAHSNRGVALGALNRHEEAMASYDHAIVLRPDFADAHLNLGNALFHLNLHEEALASYDRAIALRPDLAQAHSNRGNALGSLNRLQEAVASYDRAIALRPDFAEAHCNRGVALGNLRRHAEAIVSYDRAIAFQPDSAGAQFNKGISLLALGDYGAGWPLYEWRNKLWKSAGSGMPSCPETTDPQAMSGKRVLILSEYGLGDTLQFCRYVPMVASLAHSVVLSVQRPLVALLRDALPGVTVIDDTTMRSGFDVYCSLMSLPLAFRTNSQGIPVSVPFRSTNRTKSDAFGTRLGAKTRPRVGLVWNGGFRPGLPDAWSLSRRRDIDFGILSRVNISQIDFFSLQKGEPAESRLIEELPRFWGSDNFHNLTVDLRDFSDTQALIENLDLVISVDTSTAHLAGAMGKPVWILNRFDACWRWLVDRTDSPWYPTARLFHQPRPGDWPPVVAQVRAELLRHFDLRERVG